MLGNRLSRVSRRYFGTDGVRGVVEEELTEDLVERLGRAAALWSGGGRVFIGRDTRASGPTLEARSPRGSRRPAATRSSAACFRRLPSHCSRSTSAPSSPPRTIRPSTTASSSSTTTAGSSPRRVERRRSRRSSTRRRALLAARSTASESRPTATSSTCSSGSARIGLRIAVDCGNGAYSEIAPQAFNRLGADVLPLATEPDGLNINVGSGATDLSLLQSHSGAYDLGVAFDGDGDRMLAVDGEKPGRRRPDPRRARTSSAGRHGRCHLDDEPGLPSADGGHGIRVVTTDVGDRYVLEALRREGAILGGEQSGHIICLDGHVTGDGLAASCCSAGRWRGARSPRPPP